MSKLASHVNVVRIIGYTTWPASMGIIMEYMEGGSLETLLITKSAEVPSIPVDVRLRFGAEVASGIGFFHNIYKDQRMTHGDLKADNVLLTSDLRCKVADFGGANLATMTDPDDDAVKRANRRGEQTRVYSAPERLKNPGMKVSKAMDVYSFSMILYMILSRKQPATFDSQSQVEDYIQKVQRGERPDLEEIDNLKSSVPRSCLSDIETIEVLEDEMKKSWNQTPKYRPSIIQVRDRLNKLLVTKDPADICPKAADIMGYMNLQQPSQFKLPCATIDNFLAAHKFRNQVDGVIKQ